MRILVTGAAGFIGFHTAQALMARGDDVVGLDNLNAYYTVALKEARLARLTANSRFQFIRADCADRAAMERVFSEGPFDRVIHLAAQAGVRYSIDNPQAYIDSNITGTLNILEGCVRTGVPHLVFASTSSVYGANANMPFSEHHDANHPISMYAATKKSNELMAHVYATIHGLPVTGLRFFTVYGPWGRPDMAIFKFTQKMLAGEPIEVYGHGKHVRDFTYVDDIVDGVVRVSDRIAAADPAWSAQAPDAATAGVPYRIYNIGNAQPVVLGAFIDCLEAALGVRAEKIMLPAQPGDVHGTMADVSDLATDTGFAPNTPLADGIGRFVAWYRDYYGVGA